jgi:hypothetical protein
LITFEIGSRFIPRQAWTEILLLVFPVIAGMTGTSHHAQPLVGMGSLRLLSGLARNQDLCLPSS